MIQFLRRGLLASLLLIPLVFSVTKPALAAVHAWASVGPDGGDARSFAVDPSDPKHLYLGSTNSWIYETGMAERPGKGSPSSPPVDNLIVDDIVVDRADPKTVFVGAWVVDHQDGGFFVSHDRGETWTSAPAMKGQSIRALVAGPLERPDPHRRNSPRRLSQRRWRRAMEADQPTGKHGTP